MKSFDHYTTTTLTEIPKTKQTTNNTTKQPFHQYAMNSTTLDTTMAQETLLNTKQHYSALTHHTITQHTTPQHDTPHHITTQRTTTQQTTLLHNTTHPTTPLHNTPHHYTTHYTTPHHTTTHHYTPLHTTTQHTSSLTLWVPLETGREQ